MNYNEIARELQSHIRHGRLGDIQCLLESISNQTDIRTIDHEFITLDKQTDAINYAIDNHKEKIALYLVEKAFPLDQVYWEEKAVCDEWCGKDHGPDKCPQQYDCCKNAEQRGMERLKLRLDSIKQGRYKPGQGLCEPNVEKFLPHKPAARQQKPAYDKVEKRYIPEKKEKTHADEAREFVASFDDVTKFCSKKGGTLLHQCVGKPKVYTYILANEDVPVNIQDINGDTALHLAVRKGLADIVEALVQCSADFTLKNKMGQAPIDEAEGAIKKFLRTFEPGVKKAVVGYPFTKMSRLYKRSWCSVKAKVTRNMNLLEYTSEKAAEMLSHSESKSTTQNDPKKASEIAQKSLGILAEYKPTSELIHAVLCEDVALAKEVLRCNKGLPVNVRFRDSIGKTLLSYAIEANNYELVELLVAEGAKFAQVRVRENEQTDVTVPLFQKALRRDLDINIVKLLQSVLTDCSEHEEKDANGNTPLLRAIEMGVDTRTVHWLITVRKGYSLMDRNQDGFTAKELAIKRGRDNIVKMIDRYITKLHPVVLRMLPVAFFPAELLNIADEEKNDSETGDSFDQRLAKISDEQNYNEKKTHAVQLFTAAANGDLELIRPLNDASYQDKNGYTALIRAIAFNQLKAADELITYRPDLRKIGDNCNRYPLHYAYALPKHQGSKFIKSIVGNDGSEIDSRKDKDGVLAADYEAKRNSKEIRQMLYDARTLNVFGERGQPLGPWPQEAETCPPIMDEE